MGDYAYAEKYLDHFSWSIHFRLAPYHRNLTHLLWSVATRRPRSADDRSHARGADAKMIPAREAVRSFGSRSLSKFGPKPWRRILQFTLYSGQQR